MIGAGKKASKGFKSSKAARQGGPGKVRGKVGLCCFWFVGWLVVVYQVGQRIGMCLDLQRVNELENVLAVREVYEHV